MKPEPSPRSTADELTERWARQKPRTKTQDVLASAGCGLLLAALLGSFGYLGFVLWGEARSGQSARAARQAAAQQQQVQQAAGVLSAQPARDMEIACERAVKDRLKAPATAQFAKDTDAAWTGSAWRYTGTVDAQNSLGVPLRSRFACEVSGPDLAQARVLVDLQP
ncbi:hypothetical protein GCM10017784_32420 [Deinococcus indicus]|uniref:hypothetical protein n=1 Tax=Deinococcus indicus TaxID=223556 RepID=UPI00174DB2A2|nr:hypothetical protein [Deinococcus indicus]GHG35862.1 hypothetical protein GCM10017784_32420 [Deinococcus indicus]